MLETTGSLRGRARAQPTNDWSRSRLKHLFAELQDSIENGRAIDALLLLHDLLARDGCDPATLLPHYNNALWQAYYQAINSCDWTNYDFLVRELRYAVVRDAEFWLVGETTLTAEGLTRFHLLELNRRYCRRFGGRAGGFEHAPPDKRLKIGVLGCDFYNQATAYLFTGVAEAMDRARFHLTAYDFGDARPDTEWRRRCVAAYDEFVPIAALDDRAAAERIRADGIDVLIHMRDVPNGRLGICAFRPSPIQIQYLYFPGTSGAQFMDYFVADDVVVPPEYEDSYAERILRLPGCYQPNDGKRARPAPVGRADFGIDPDRIVIGNFSQNYKITPDIFAAWCDLLRVSPDRVLWLLDPGELARGNLRREALLLGVDPERLIFSSTMDSAVHLARIACTDLILDTFPYGGHTLTSDALWAGTPVVTLMGQTYASRVPASILANCGAPELAVTSLADYVGLANYLLNNREELAAKRAAICHARDAGDLFDQQAYADKFGAAIEDVVRRRWGTDPV